MRVVFKKRGKLSKNLKWTPETEETEVANNIKYLGIILDCRGNGRRNGHIRGELTLNRINICSARAPNTDIIQILNFWTLSIVQFLSKILSCFYFKKITNVI